MLARAVLSPGVVGTGSLQTPLFQLHAKLLQSLFFVSDAQPEPPTLVVVSSAVGPGAEGEVVTVGATADPAASVVASVAADVVYASRSS
jgi:hypothetical protein